MDKLKTLIFWLLLLTTIGALVYHGYSLAVLPLFFCFWFGSATWDRLSQRRAIVDNPVSTIRGAAMGNVQINGRIVGDESKSPLTKRDCAFWYLEATDLSGDDQNSRLYKAFANRLVQVNDGTGTVWVRANDIGWRDLKDKVTQTLTTTQADQVLGDLFGGYSFDTASFLREILTLSDDAPLAEDGTSRDPSRELQRKMHERAATMDSKKVERVNKLMGTMISAMDTVSNLKQRKMHERAATMDSQKGERANKLMGTMISAIDTVSNLNSDNWSIDEIVVPSGQSVFFSGKLVSVTSNSPCPFKDAIGQHDPDRDDIEARWTEAMTKLEEKEAGQTLDGSKEVLVLLPSLKDWVIEVSTGNKGNELAQINKSLIINGALFGISALALLYAIQT